MFVSFGQGLAAVIRRQMFGVGVLGSPCFGPLKDAAGCGSREDQQEDCRGDPFYHTRYEGPTIRRYLT